ncbi:MAG TPA: T9SS type A sorting domain-containing protein [Ferruginibacter sp.]|nr:T9SS type A sorting domain-containing protein [Ferruginibacter sp.]HMP19376.1 T9SS type A sorting domain-containing protein [Ferruginibacter sp.]
MKKMYLSAVMLISIAATTQAQLTINSQFINPCGGDEHNEFIIAKTGSNGVDIANISFGSYNPSSNNNGVGGTAVVDYNYWWAGTNAVSSPYPTFSDYPGESCGSGLTCYGFRYPSVPADETDINALINELNTIAGCNVFLAVPSTNIIPANSNVAIFVGAGFRSASGLCGFHDAVTNMNFSNHCSGTDPVVTYYAVFGTGSGAGPNCTTTTGGYFSNSSRRISALHVFNGGDNTVAANYTSSFQDYTPGAASGATNAGLIIPSGSNGTTWINNQGCMPSPFVIVPVKLSYFTGSASAKKSVLKWKSEYEEEVLHFIIEKSYNGRDFVEMGSVKAKNISGSVYNFTDELPAAGNNFYRLKTISANGLIEYSHIVKVNFARTASAWTITPNPAEGYASLLYTADAAKNIMIKVSDIAGRTVSAAAYNVYPGSNRLILAGRQLASGTYLVTVMDGGKASSAVLIKK